MKFKFCIFITLAICSTLNSFSTDKKKVASASNYAKKAKITKSLSSSNQSSTESLVEIQAADASDYYSSLNGNELMDLIGKNVNDASIQRVVKSMKSDFELINSSGFITYFWRNEGLAFKFDNRSSLNQISFYSATEAMGAFCNAFNYSLPEGLSFNQSRNKVEEIIGLPLEASTPSGDEKFYAKYLINNSNYNLYITYNSNSSKEMNCNISEVLVTKADKNTIIISSLSENKSQLEKKSAINSNNNTISEKDSDNKNPISFLGKPSNDEGLTQYLNNLGTKEIQIIDYQQSSQYINKKEGIILNYDNSSILASVIFNNSTQYLGETCSQYQGKLPEGINFSLSMQEVEERLGTPVQTSNNTESKYWEMYSINNGSEAMYITYNTNNSTIKNASISDIRVEKLK